MTAEPKRPRPKAQAAPPGDDWRSKLGLPAGKGKRNTRASKEARAELEATMAAVRGTLKQRSPE